MKKKLKKDGVINIRSLLTVITLKDSARKHIAKAKRKR